MKSMRVHANGMRPLLKSTAAPQGHMVARADPQDIMVRCVYTTYEQLLSPLLVQCSGKAKTTLLPYVLPT